jgi:serine/threonine-protein phosphatase 2B catalytic subunit
MHRWDGPASFPYVITIFSAPNYCGYYENKASVLIIDRGNLSLKQYDESEPPYKLPDNMDVFSWSMPFLAEKITQMLVTIVSKFDTDDDEGDLNLNEKDLTGMSKEEIMEKKSRMMKNKVKSIAKMSKMFATLREESETLLKIKNMSPDGKLPRGLLLDGKPAIRNALK